MRAGPLLTGLVALLVAPAAHAGVTINEFLANPDGSDGGQEWVELHNDGGSAVDVSGWQFQAGTSSLSTKVVLPAGTTIPGGGFLVIGEADVTFADVTVDGTLAMGNASSSGDAIALLDDAGTTIDTIVYGPDNSDLFQDDDGNVAAPGPSPSSGGTLGRDPDGADTNDSSLDIVSLPVPTPGATNNATVDPDCNPADQARGLVINEFLPNPDGADDGQEWVELYNGAGASVDASGWILEGGTSSFGTLATLPDSTTLAPGAFLLVGQDLVSGRDVILDGSLPNASSNSDALRLRDCAGAVADTVVYGAPNEDMWPDDTGAVATSFAPEPGNDEAIARREDGVDTDRSGDDFAVATMATPGAANPEPPPCDTGDLVINEFLANPEGGDTGFEWVELYNAGSETITVAGWTLDASTSSFGGGDLLADVTIEAGGHLLIGAESVMDADIVLEGFSLGNASGETADGIQLRDCRGDVIDTVVYGPANGDGFVDDTGKVATSLAPPPADGASLARLQDGLDTDDSQADFASEPEPTPGAPNPEREPVVCVPAGAETVVLNEVVVNPEGDDAGFEWIELFNPTSAPVSVAGWGIAAASDGEEMGQIDARFPGGAEVPAGGFLVLGGPEVEEADLVVGLSLGNGSGGDAVVLWDCADTRIDSVLYGSDNEDMVTDDRGAVVEPYVTSISSGGSLARVEDGVDTDVAVDWYDNAFPTPGASNTRETGDDSPEGGCSCGNDPTEAPDDPAEPGGCGGTPPPPAALLIVVLGLGLVRRRG